MTRVGALGADRRSLLAAWLGAIAVGIIALALLLVAMSVLVNAWGVVWGDVLGW